jgi:hypothetical protein
MDQTELLTYADGELHPSEAAAVEKHLAGCVECRLRMAQVRSDLDDVITRHRERKIAALRSGPAWADLRGEFDRLDGKKAARRFLHFPAARTWIGVAAAGLIAALIWNISTERTVSAAELLGKASSRPDDLQPNRRIVIKTGRQQFVRPARLGGVTLPRATAANDTSELRSLFERANFSWEDPLSARSFARWRDQLPEKQDQVSVLQIGADRLYRIRTSSAHNVLSEATLMMRVGDLRAVHETLQFGERELIEIAETSPAEPAAPATPRAPGTRIATEPPVSVETPAGPAEELRVLAALNEIGADLGEPIDVKRDEVNQRITITGIDVDTRRQQQIRAAVRDIPGVEIAFTQGQPVEAATTREPADSVTAGRRSALHDQLEARLGAGERVDAFIDRIVGESESALARAHALRNLAVRFPPEVEQTLSPNDQQILHSLRGRHLQALGAVSQSIERQITDLLGSGRTANARACGSWQECTGPLLSASQKFDEVLNAALAGAGGGKPLAAGDLISALTIWRVQIGVLAEAAGATR